MRRRRVLFLFVLLAMALGLGGVILLRPHPIVGRWKLDLPANSAGIGKRLILLSDGTGDMDGNSFRYRIVDGNNLVVTYPTKDVYVWPFTLEGDHLKVTAFKETEDFTREEPPQS